MTVRLVITAALVALFADGVTPYGIAHVTGGGIPGNLGRLLEKRQLGAELSNLWEPHPFMQELRELGKITAEQAYGTWNMGNGLLLIVEEREEERTLAILRSQGQEAKVAGVITEGDDITIRTKEQDVKIHV